MDTRRRIEAPIERVGVEAFRIPTDAPESDGTLEWDSTTLVLVEASAGGETGLGYSYTGRAAATLVDDLLAGIVTGRDAMDTPACWQAMVDAILGTQANFTALDGPVDVEVRAGTQSAEIVTVKNRGITRLRGNGRGDLRIGIQVVTPTKLDHKEKELIKKFASSHKTAEPSLARFQQGLFAKLRDRFLNL